MLKKIIFWVVMITLFVSLSLIILVAALGYKVNWVSFSVSETSLIWLRGNQNKITVYLDQKKVANKLPIRLNYVSPGWRQIRVAKPGYYNWEKNIHVEANKAYEYRDIIFFKKDNNPSIVSNERELALLDQAVLPMNLTVVNGELRANDRLVSRFFSDPQYYQWYDDGRHIIFQISNSIRIIDTDGQNDHLLVDLKSDQPSVFILTDSDKNLIYRDGDIVKKAKIK